MARDPWLASGSARGPKSFKYAALVRPRVRAPRGPGRLGGRSAMAHRGPSIVGRSVVDSEGTEIGYVSREEPDFLVIGEGATGRLRLGRRFVQRIEDRVVLRGTALEMFTGLNVLDAQGEFVGIVRDTVEADDVLDSFIVEDEKGEMVNVMLEDVRSIGDWLELSVAQDALYEGG
ncbi:MAG: hypothetical protein A3K59_11115 [Euryarchaeota archaeon RBG_19FT_COMBO_69_17]|nr:MAG: hypothetical protein A3K59_11115 [Euryarchaeota archaeon RBG_19FT_COMBO_69_17]